MKKHKRWCAILLAAVLLPTCVSADRKQVQADTAALASSYNANAYAVAYSSEVENQEAENYCWAYMADAVLESYLMKNAGISQVNFSEADMISQLSGGTHGFTDLSNGGNFHQALAYWTRGSQYGPCLEEGGKPASYYVSETTELGRYDITDAQSKQEYIQNIKNLLVSYGSVGASIYFNEADRQVTTKDGAYFYPEDSSPGVNHGVTIVGWDDTFMPQWFQNDKVALHQPQRRGAFLVKNSWGKDDVGSIGGNTGYYWVSYENYFQDAFAVTQVLERSRLYDDIYETDYRGFYEFAQGDHYSQLCLLRSSGQQLSGFATYVKKGAHYRFYANGQELTDLGGVMVHTGYHTFQLPRPLAIDGVSLELRVEVESSGNAVPIASAADARSAEAGNACLKVFTKRPSTNQTPAGTLPPQSSATNPVNPGTSGAVVTQVMVSPQECSVYQGVSQSFNAQVYGNGQPSQQITWQLSGSSSTNTRISDGVLYVAPDEASQTLYIYANSSVDSSKSAAAKVSVIKASTASNGTVPGTGGSGASPGTSSGTGSSVSPGTTSGTGSNISPGVPSGSGTGSSVSPGVPQGSGTGSSVLPDTSSGTGSSVSPGTPSGTGNTASSAGGNGIEQVSKVGKGIYACWGNGTAQYTKCTSTSLTSISIPASVTVGGRTYSVSTLQSQCLRNNKKIKTATIGKNVTEIGEEAFSGCSSLKKIKVKSTKVKSIGADAFEGVAQKACIYVPKNSLSKYRILVRESGNSNVRIKAYN